MDRNLTQMHSVGSQEVYQFDHINSSPYFPRSNEEAEKWLKTVKALLKKGDKPYLALPAFKSTSLSNGYTFTWRAPNEQEAEN